MFPPSMLARLFVKDSLKNTENGFGMKLKNIIDSGTITGFGPLVVDGTNYEPSQSTVKIGETVVSGDQVTRDHPLYARAMSEIIITVNAPPLEPGEHKIVFQFMTREAGRISFSVTESLKA